MKGTVLQCIRFLTDLTDTGRMYEIKEYHERRSLTQNAYYYVLLSKVADALRMSKTELHNRMLRDYGQIAIIGDKLVPVSVPDTEEGEKDTLRQEHFHLKPTSSVREGRDGVNYRTYVLLRGSHEYNTTEMSILLDGLIQEARTLDIETLTPDELERMRAHEEKKHNKAG